MSLKNDPAETAIAVSLPARVFTHAGSSFDPREDIWEWTDGPFQVHINFEGYVGEFRGLVPFLKQALIPWVVGADRNLTHLQR